MALTLAFIIGLIGNVTSFAVYASPIPTFCIICKKKSTEMFSVVPYIFSLLTAAFGVYYGLLKAGILIISVNSIGCIFELAYIIVFYKFGSKSIRRKAGKLLLSEILFFGTVVCLTMLLTQGKTRIIAVGSIASVIAIMMYASPLSIMRTVIRTKNVEAMPLTLSIFLLINGAIWSAYALYTTDIFIGIPSVVGCLFAIGQIALYTVCRIARDHEKPEGSESSKHHIIDLKEAADVKDAMKVPRQPSINGTAFRTASGKVIDILKELPNGFAGNRTASGKLFKDSPHYVELAKQ